MIQKDIHMAGHVDEMTCLLYLEGQLERARAYEVSAHTEECSGCRTLLRALERESRLLTRAMIEVDEPLPARLAALPGRSAPPLHWIWGTVLGLAATGIYGLYAGYLEPLMERLDQAGFGGSNLIGILVFQGAFWKGWQSMISLAQILALATLAGAAALFARRWLRRPSTVALVLSGLCVLLALPGAAGAAEVRHAQIYTLHKDEVIKNDLYVAGGRVRIGGTVEGDLVAAGESVEVDGHITGDVIAFTKYLRITGKVDGSVRVFANTVTLSGAVGRNVTIFTEVFEQDSNSQINGGVTAFAGSISLDGKIGRDFLAIAGHTTLTGFIGGDFRLKGRALSIGSTAQIQGRSEFTGKEPAEVSPQANLGSPLVYEQYREDARRWASHHYGFQIIWSAGTMLFGLVLFLLLPEFARQTAGAAGRYGASFGLGLLMLIGVPITVVFACVTLVGIPLGIAAFVLWLAMLYSAQLAVGAILGGWLLGSAPPGDAWALAARMLLGVVVIRILFNVPHLGGLAHLAVFLWGMGAIALAVYKRFQPASPALPSAPAAQTA